jgi:penicillin-binding protein 2
VETTPLQLARTIGGIAMGGIFKQPHLIKDAQNVGEERFQLSEPTIQKVTDGMWGVVNEGTAKQLKIAGVEFAGKSGTAQIINYDLRNRVGKKGEFKDNSWFVGYAPHRTPEIVVSVIVQGGGHGSEAAGPVVRDVIKAYYDKKNKKVDGQITADDKGFDPGKTAPQATVIHPVLKQRGQVGPPEAVPARERTAEIRQH